VANAYKNFCETLWRSWLAGTLDVPPSLRRDFDLDAAPEPYLTFGAGARPLVVLTTNPGATMRHQRRSVILRGGGPVVAGARYEAVADTLGAFYAEHLRGAAH
jgi:hypothetical protein